MNKRIRVPLDAREAYLPRVIFACLAAFSTLAVCSKSSFLYPMNDWVDVNCFFTVGRGILHGLVPYRDLYEQKGPLIYFLFALAGRISESSFLGVYLLEGICFSFFLYLGGRIAETLSERKNAFWPSAALLAALVPVTPAFSHGSSAEEFFLPALALGLFLVLKAMREDRPLTDGQGLALGLCAAAALWTKYTFCGLYAGLALAVLIWYPFTGRARRLPRLILFFLLGCLALSASVVLWFALRGALGDLWQAYFVNNLSRYSQNVRSGHYDPPLKNLLNNLPWSIPGALGLVSLTSMKPSRSFWPAFAPLGLGAAASLTARLVKNVRPRVKAVSAAALGFVLLIAGPFAALRMSPNTYLMRVRKEEMPQTRFAGIIRQSDDASLLNYGFLDGGFYFAAGVLPSGPYFCTLNIDLPEAEEALRESVLQGKTAFVVTRSNKLKNSGMYRLADEADLFFEGRTWHYYLYRRTE